MVTMCFELLHRVYFDFSDVLNFNTSVVAWVFAVYLKDQRGW